MTWFEHVNSFARATPWLHAPMVLFARYGIVLFAGLLLASWWLAHRRQDRHAVTAALWAPLGALLAVGLNQPLAAAAGTARPFTVFPHALVLVTRSSDPSFPSDHAVMAGAVTAGVLLANRRLGLLTGALALLMAFARVYVGVHFPADVIAGLGFGAAVTALGHVVAHRPLDRALAALAGTPLRPLLLEHRHELEAEHDGPEQPADRTGSADELVKGPHDERTLTDGLQGHRPVDQV